MPYEPCKFCGISTNLIDLKSNDGRMTGRYCSRSHIEEHRQSIPPYQDPIWTKEGDEDDTYLDGPEDTLTEEEVHDTTKGMMEKSGLNKLFGFLEEL